jgi:succinate dehydrogenase/fumarate reductase flavoprotein subunit
MSEPDYDVIVIGSGTAGMSAAVEARFYIAIQPALAHDAAVIFPIRSE